MWGLPGVADHTEHTIVSVGRLPATIIERANGEEGTRLREATDADAAREQAGSILREPRSRRPAPREDQDPQPGVALFDQDFADIERPPADSDTGREGKRHNPHHGEVGMNATMKKSIDREMRVRR